MTLTPKKRAHALLAALALSEEDTTTRLAQAGDLDYWRQLNPQLTIGGTGEPSVAESAPWPADVLDAHVRHLATAGYLQAAPFLDPERIIALRTAVERLRAAGWPPVFLFVYDQVWDLARTPSVQALLRSALGPGFREDSLVWCFHVAPKAGASGWAPHFDGPERSNRLTLWFPLTDATLDNGCMYIVPDGMLPPSVDNSGGEVALGWNDVNAMLRAVRALPCDAGGLLSWRFHVLHWSAIARAASHPRISVAMEFLGTDVEPQPLEKPLLDGSRRPDDVSMRLYAIGKSLKTYITFEPGLAPFAQVAARLEAAYRPVGAGTT